jgi:sugar-phosphatase
MTKAIILDMDGLLIDSELFWREVEMKIFTKLGVPLTEERCPETMGLRTDEVADYWFSRYPWKEPTKGEVASQINKEVIALIEAKGQAKPGVDHVIGLIKEMGLKSGLASSSVTDLIDAVIKKLDIKKDLEVVYSAEHEPYGKPHPGVYIATAQKLGVHPTECIAIEDSANGLLAAKAAKMKCIAVPDPLAKDRREFCVADAVLGSLEEITKEMIANL